MSATQARSLVATGGGGGIGRVIAEAARAEWAVVVLEHDERAIGWTRTAGVAAVVGDAGEAAVAQRAAAAAEGMAPLAGWVNNAAVFDDPRASDGPERLVSAKRRRRSRQPRARSPSTTDLWASASTRSRLGRSSRSVRRLT